MRTMFTRAHVESLGFTGFVPASSLRASRCREIPGIPGVYAVLRDGEDPPVFLNESVGGWFKDNDPTVRVHVLKQRWLADSPVLYIGKAGTSLRTRVRALVDYGGGRPVGHQGGRYLWQVVGCDSFVVAWRLAENARALESNLLDEFVSAHGQLPYANLSH